jgi:hypothetical protein
VRFWDPVERAFVADGLVVNVRPANGQRRTLAAANSAAIFVAQDLPFLRSAEQGAGDDAYWASVARRAFVVEVDDTRGRFLPFSFPASLPNRGLFVWSCPLVSPPLPPLADGVLLFSAPSRPPSPMRAVLRADLQDLATGLPAAGAVLVATIDGARSVSGVADERGRVAIQFPYPEPRDFPPIGDGASPPASPVGSSLASHTWPVVLAGQYAVTSPYPAYPDLCTTLHQPAAKLLADSAGTPLGQQLLTMGADLVLRSTDASTGRPMSVLLVQR